MSERSSRARAVVSGTDAAAASPDGFPRRLWRGSCTGRSGFARFLKGRPAAERSHVHSWAAAARAGPDRREPRRSSSRFHPPVWSSSPAWGSRAGKPSTEPLETAAAAAGWRKDASWKRQGELAGQVAGVKPGEPLVLSAEVDNAERALETIESGPPGSNSMKPSHPAGPGIAIENAARAVGCARGTQTRRARP